MPIYRDATGYLIGLANAVGEQWFTMVCDLAVIVGSPTLDQDVLATLIALFRKQASYLGITPGVPVSVPPTPAPTADFLEKLSGFSNFKLLAGTLEIGFTRRLTLVFGANGSGKSSLCQALKVLSSPEPPSRPLHNLRSAPTTTPPQFRFKFKSDTVDQSWTHTAGYGPRQASVKYFDIDIAHNNVKIASVRGEGA